MTTTRGDPNLISTRCVPQCAHWCTAILAVTFLKHASAWFWSRTVLIMEAGNKKTNSPNWTELMLACHLKHRLHPHGGAYHVINSYFTKMCGRLGHDGLFFLCYSRISAKLCGATGLGGSVRPSSCQLPKVQPAAPIWWFSTCSICVCVFCDMIARLLSLE